MQRWGPMFVMMKMTYRLRRALTQRLPSNSSEDAPPALFCADLMIAAGGDLHRAYHAVLPSPGGCCFEKRLTSEAGN